MGAMPMIIASAVMMTGLNRVTPAWSAALTGSPVASSSCRAKLTTRTLLAVATPIHMMAPVNAGTLSGVPVVKSVHTMPASAAGRAVMITKGSVQD